MGSGGLSHGTPREVQMVANSLQSNIPTTLAPFFLAYLQDEGFQVPRAGEACGMTYAEPDSRDLSEGLPSQRRKGELPARSG